MRKPTLVPAAFAAGLLASIALACLAAPAGAAAPSGAIFTTLADGSEVNFNIYAAKEDVYLDGGPGLGAPATAAGLDDGTYVFQVTDPSGKVLLSQDAAGCRQFTVSGGVITSVAPSGACAHLTGTDVDHDATTVQLMPYADTPNNGGVYKVWATLVEDYLEGCAALGVASGLTVVDCGYQPGVAVHGFIPAESKTDNFKVKNVVPQEIDTRFFDSEGNVIDGLGIDWIDPTGASNRKWSYYKPERYVIHEAHVEAVTAGTHVIKVANQPGCTVGQVFGANGRVFGFGPQDVPVKVTNTPKEFTLRVDVSCL